jgi:hypothetical protein
VSVQLPDEVAPPVDGLAALEMELEPPVLPPAPTETVPLVREPPETLNVLPPTLVLAEVTFVAPPLPKTKPPVLIGEIDVIPPELPREPPAPIARSLAGSPWQALAATTNSVSHEGARNGEFGGTKVIYE